VIDTSVDERFIAAYWVVTTLDERGKYTNNILSSKRTNEAVPTAEGIGLLNLIKEINNQTKHMIEGKIIIYSDNKKSNKWSDN